MERLVMAASTPAKIAQKSAFDWLRSAYSGSAFTQKYALSRHSSSRSMLTGTSRSSASLSVGFCVISPSLTGQGSATDRRERLVDMRRIWKEQPVCPVDQRTVDTSQAPGA